MDNRLNIGPGPDVRELKLGSTFTNSAPSSVFHTIKYDFKPASVDVNKPAVLEVSANKQVTVTVPHLDGSGVPNTVFKGNHRDYSRKECVLILNRATGEITLEQLNSSIGVKKTRIENKVVNPPPPLPTIKVENNTARQSSKTKITTGVRKNAPISFVPKHSPLQGSPSYPHRSPQSAPAWNANNTQQTLPSIPMIGLDDGMDFGNAMPPAASASSSSSSSSAGPPPPAIVASSLMNNHMNNSTSNNNTSSSSSSNSSNSNSNNNNNHHHHSGGHHNNINNNNNTNSNTNNSNHSMNNNHSSSGGGGGGYMNHGSGGHNNLNNTNSNHHIGGGSGSSISNNNGNGNSSSHHHNNHHLSAPSLPSAYGNSGARNHLHSSEPGVGGVSAPNVEVSLPPERDLLPPPPAAVTGLGGPGGSSDPEMMTSSESDGSDDSDSSSSDQESDSSTEDNNDSPVKESIFDPRPVLSTVGASVAAVDLSKDLCLSSNSDSDD
uniref:Ell-associated factor Eaf n=1 Tax=Anopheles triannulatus TaxID=58253 RepID=A0A2M4A836_9DIPT